MPTRFTVINLSFSPLFFQRSRGYAEVGLLAAILASGKRTVTSLLADLRAARERRFVNYHRVLNHTAWSPRAASRLLLDLLVAAFVPAGTVVLGIRIGTKRIYPDPVRSSHGHFVKASGLRWLSLMLPVPIPWAGRVRAPG